MVDVSDSKRAAWNAQAHGKNRGTVPAAPAEIEVARRVELKILLTPHRPVPSSWLSEIEGAYSPGEDALSTDILSFIAIRTHKERP